MNKWNSLPEWLRWILCWPVIVVIGLVMSLVSMFLASSLLNESWLPNSVEYILLPAICTFIAGPILFALIHEFVPRKPNLFTGFVVCISTVLGILSLVRWYFEVVYGFEWNPLLRDIFQTVTAVGTSWYWFYFFKERSSKIRNLKA